MCDNWKGALTHKLWLADGSGTIAESRDWGEIIRVACTAWLQGQDVTL
jgi:hypothetical protein